MAFPATYEWIFIIICLFLNLHGGKGLSCNESKSYVINVWACELRVSVLFSLTRLRLIVDGLVCFFFQLNGNECGWGLLNSLFSKIFLAFLFTRGHVMEICAGWLDIPLEWEMKLVGRCSFAFGVWLSIVLGIYLITEMKYNKQHAAVSHFTVVCLENIIIS